jgi:hypothetical protein
VCSPSLIVWIVNIYSHAIEFDFIVFINFVLRIIHGHKPGSSALWAGFAVYFARAAAFRARRELLILDAFLALLIALLTGAPKLSDPVPNLAAVLPNKVQLDFIARDGGG